jgi:L-histidine N-alpha-methyltransferase
MLVSPVSAEPVSQFAADVCEGLMRGGQKELPSRYLYDTVGSRLFEVITALPEYGLTRAEERLLTAHAEELAARLPSPVLVAELGSGSGKKTRCILEALCGRHPTSYFPIEISASALHLCELEVGDIDSISIVGLERDYLDGLKEVTARRGPGEHLLVLFLGSTIGNFDRPAAVNFLQAVREMLQPGDSLLLGTDLEKPLPALIQAYDDPLRVTAAFNLNLLSRINRELDGDFDLAQFEHVAKFEMHLRSKRAQIVTIAKAQLSVVFSKDETIWTESCHKYASREVFDIARDCGFRCEAQWIDEEWPFADNLLMAI